MLTRTTAQTLHDQARTLGVFLVWLVSDADSEHPGKVVARPYTADPKGRVYLVGALLADTLDDLHAQMPEGLTVHPREAFHLPEIIQTWE
jgi:hypothetical protein